MPLSVGIKLGRYEIRAQLGVGGMGEVYLAQDTKLHRDVPVKILPEAIAQDVERLAQFVREAHVLAALDGSRKIAGVSALSKCTRTGEVSTWGRPFLAGSGLVRNSIPPSVKCH